MRFIFPRSITWSRPTVCTLRLRQVGTPSLVTFSLVFRPCTPRPCTRTSVRNGTWNMPVLSWVVCPVWSSSPSTFSTGRARRSARGASSLNRLLPTGLRTKAGVSAGLPASHNRFNPIDLFSMISPCRQMNHYWPAFYLLFTCLHCSEQVLFPLGAHESFGCMHLFV